VREQGSHTRRNVKINLIKIRPAVFALKYEDIKGQTSTVLLSYQANLQRSLNNLSGRK